MFRNDSITKKLHTIKIDNYDLYNLGLYLEKDYIFTYVKSEEYEVRYVPGRDMPYKKHIRNLPIDLNIEFKLKESNNFNKRIDDITSILNNSKDKILTLNNENKGFKIYFSEITNIKRGIGSDSITIKFFCYPDLFER